MLKAMNKAAHVPAKTMTEKVRGKDEKKLTAGDNSSFFYYRKL